MTTNARIIREALDGCAEASTTRVLGSESEGRAMKVTIGGSLTTDALARLHFNTLSYAEKVAAIGRLAASGQGEHTIAHATGLSVEALRAILTERPG